MQTLREEGRPWRNFANIPRSLFIADRAAIIARATALHTIHAQAAGAGAAAAAAPVARVVVMASLAAVPPGGVPPAAVVVAQLMMPPPAMAPPPPIAALDPPQQDAAPPSPLVAPVPPPVAALAPFVLLQVDDEEEDALDVSVLIDTGYDFEFFDVGDLVLAWRGRDAAGGHVFLPAQVRSVDEHLSTLTLRFDGDTYNIAHYNPEYCKPRDDDHQNYDVMESQ